ncbi:sensory box histidine kinase/response regulator [alpha proteobacterium U9-1i]|nr:sensory box histidine kinase/response regulator [alpha proteobacterium U9-1i]
MTITQKAIAALVAVFLALFAGSAIILDRAVRPEFEQLEAEAHARDRARVVANLDALRNDIRQRATDYAYWDDTYLFARGDNPDFVDDYGDDWFADYGVDLMIVGDDQGRVFWALGGAARGAAAVDRGAAAALVTLTRQVNETREATSGVTWLDGYGFAVYGAAPITMSDGSGAPRGVFIIAKRLSDAALSTQVQLELTLMHADEQNDAHLNGLQTQDAMTWTGRKELLSLIALRDSNGLLVGAAAARQARDITALGSRATTITLALFAGISALLAILLWVLLRVGILRRLDRMEKHFNDSGEPTPLASDAIVDDEITRLIDAYNALVARSGEAAIRAKDAQMQRDAAATANRLKSDFLANISHELRTPLNAVIGYADLISEDLADGRTETARADLENITGAARHVLTMVNDILDLSKLEAGSLTLKPQAFDVAEFVREAISVTAPVARARACSINVDIQPGIGVVFSDQARLRQCLVSALTHACGASEGAAVRLRAERCAIGPRADIVRFEINASGPAPSDEQLARMFEAYRSADLTADDGGAGLGLAVTRRVIALLGGAIEARGGDGLTFVLTAPVVLKEPIQRAA